MLVFKDRSTHHIFALKRIFKSTIYSPLGQEENGHQAVEKSRDARALLSCAEHFLHLPNCPDWPEHIEVI
jgi:hypothetical protein